MARPGTCGRRWRSRCSPPAHGHHVLIALGVDACADLQHLLGAELHAVAAALAALRHNFHFCHTDISFLHIASCKLLNRGLRCVRLRPGRPGIGQPQADGEHRAGQPLRQGGAQLPADAQVIHRLVGAHQLPEPPGALRHVGGVVSGPRLGLPTSRSRASSTWETPGSPPAPGQCAPGWPTRGGRG